MSIITPFSTPGPTSSDPANFDARADNFVGVEWPRFISEANLLEANLGAAAAPGGNMVPYAFASSTTVGDPGAGNLRLNNATQASATVIYADLASAIGTDATELLDKMGAGTSAVKGQLRLSKVGDPTKFLLFDVTGVTTPGGGGYRQIAVSGGLPAGASPFADTDALTISFARAGDKGPIGDPASWTLLTTTTISGSPTTVTFSSIAQTYSDLSFVFDAVTNSAGSPNLTVAVSDGSTFSSPLDSGSNNSSAMGEVIIAGYRRDISFLTVQLGTSVSSPGIAAAAGASSSTKLATAPIRVVGGIQGVRFAWNGGETFASGAIKLFGR